METVKPTEGTACEVLFIYESHTAQAYLIYRCSVSGCPIAAQNKTMKQQRRAESKLLFGKKSVSQNFTNAGNRLL